MTKAEIIDLLNKYHEGTSSSEENELLESWYNLTAKTADTPFPESVWARKEATYTYIVNRENTKAYNAGVKIKLLPRIAGIAAAVAAIAFGIWFYSSSRHLDDRRDLLNYAQDIAPGKNTATLTVNGKSMLLSEAQTGVKVDNNKFTYKDGSPLSPQGEALLQGEHSMVTATTPRGGTYEFILQDGTKVWLNADSRLEFFPNYQNKKQRIVKLEGEGYFEVAKDKTKPFIVESAGQKVEVLGTHFNLSAYKDESGIKTTLIEGSVKVSSGRNQQLLKPGYQAINNGSIIKVTAANVEQATDWKEGDFNLDRIDFKTAMRKIERWYNVEVVYDASVPADIETGGWISRKQSLSAVLKFIESSGLAHFRIEGRKVYISK